MHNAYNTELAAHTTHSTLPAPEPQPRTLRFQLAAGLRHHLRPATASSEPVSQSSGADACVAAASAPQSDADITATGINGKTKLIGLLRVDLLVTVVVVYSSQARSYSVHSTVDKRYPQSMGGTK